jgi:hypothetical protein
MITTTEELLKTFPRQRRNGQVHRRRKKRTLQDGSTRTYLRERIDQKRTEYDRRIQKDKEETISETYMNIQAAP